MPTTPTEAKAWVRSCLSGFRRSLSEAERTRLSAAVTRRVGRNPVFRASRRVAVFIGFGSEVQTEPLVSLCRRQGKVVFIPDLRLGFSRPRFIRYDESDRLVKTHLGPMELAGVRKPAPVGALDLIFVPGLGFDRFGHRIGYGGGVYDRIISGSRRAHHMGLFFSFQRVNRLPVNPWDRPLDSAITDRETISLS